jgi:hypothetical protein
MYSYADVAGFPAGTDLIQEMALSRAYMPLVGIIIVKKDKKGGL